MIRSRAAICVEPHARLVVDDILVAPPGEGEVLVELAATGLCHTDLTAIDGQNPSCVYPAVLGHEGAGVVVETGAGVKSLAAGDHVIPLYGPECGVCAMCRNPRTNLCWSIKRTRDRGVMPDGSSRLRWRGETLHHFMGTSTFSRYAVVPEIALARVPREVPLEHACLFGCCVTTGVGAALNDVRPDDDVIVFGLGGIGVNIVQGARIAGARRVIGVDLHAAKAELARTLGLTHFVGGSSPGVAAELLELTGGGADVAFECTGSLAAMRSAFDACKPGSGTCVLLGVEPKGAELAIPPVALRYGKTLKGSYFGGVRGRTGMDRLFRLYASGDLQAEPLITSRIALEQVNDGFAAMRRGEGLRSVIGLTA